MPTLTVRADQVPVDRIEEIENIIQTGFFRIASGEISPDRAARGFIETLGTHRLHSVLPQRGHYEHKDIGVEPILRQVMYGWVNGTDPLATLEKAPRCAERLSNLGGTIEEVATLAREGVVNNTNRATVIGRPDPLFIETFNRFESLWVEGKSADPKSAADELRIRDYSSRAEETAASIPGLSIEDLPTKERTHLLSPHSSSITDLRYVERDIQGFARIEFLFDLTKIPRSEAPAAYFAISAADLLGSKDTPFAVLGDRKAKVSDNPYSEFAPHFGTDASRAIGYFSTRAQTRPEVAKEYLALTMESFLNPHFDQADVLPAMLNNNLRWLEYIPAMNPDGAAVRWMLSKVLSDVHPSFDLFDRVGGFEYLNQFRQWEQMARIDWSGFIDMLQAGAQSYLRRELVSPTIVSSKSIYGQVEPLLAEAMDRFPRLGDGGLVAPGRQEKVSGIAKHLAYRSDSPVSQTLGAFVLPEHMDINSGMGQIVGALVTRQFLWNEIRLASQAYGSSLLYLESARTLAAVSLSDSNPLRSLDVFSRMGEYLSSGAITQDQLDATKVSLIGTLETPTSPLQEGMGALFNELNGFTAEYRQRSRDTILGTTLEQVSEFGRALSSIPRSGTFIIGQQQILEQAGLPIINE